MAMIINYDCNMLIVEATVAMIINYDRNMFIVQVTVALIINNHVYSIDHSGYEHKLRL
jgi:hypothetical protein